MSVLGFLQASAIRTATVTDFLKHDILPYNTKKNHAYIKSLADYNSAYSSHFATSGGAINKPRKKPKAEAA